MCWWWPAPAPWAWQHPPQCWWPRQQARPLTAAACSCTALWRQSDARGLFVVAQPWWHKPPLHARQPTWAAPAVTLFVAGARRGLLLRGGDVIEGLAQVDTVVLDKTGTLTGGCAPACPPARLLECLPASPRCDWPGRLSSGRHQALVASRRPCSKHQWTDTLDAPCCGLPWACLQRGGCS